MRIPVLHGGDVGNYKEAVRIRHAVDRGHGGVVSVFGRPLPDTGSVWNLPVGAPDSQTPWQPLPAPVAGKVGHNLPSPSVIFPYIMHRDLDVRRIQETELEYGVLDMKWQVHIILKFCLKI